MSIQNQVLRESAVINPTKPKPIIDNPESTLIILIQHAIE
jgi:hypothetical protein